MQTFVKCPFCGTVFDAATERSVAVMVDGVRRTAHQACAMRMAGPPPDLKPNGDAKGNGALNLRPAEAVE